MWNGIYLVTLIPGALVIAGNLLGGPWAVGNLALLAVLGALDWLLGANDDDNRRGGPIPRAIPFLHVIVHTAAVASLLYGVAGGRLAGGWLCCALLSTAVHSATVGGNTAHELVHKRGLRRWLGIWNLLWVGYAHFAVEHVRGHHAHFGETGDPATSRRGESFYLYFLRTLPQQYRSAWDLEARRLRRRGRPAWGPGNFVLITSVVEFGLAALIFAALGPLCGLTLVGHALAARFFMESANYLGHYGLVRDAREPATAHHSWQSNNRVSRVLLLDVARHVDHHRHPARGFCDLNSCNDAPRLPAGNLGLCLVILIPPLWFALIHPVLDRMPRLGADGLGGSAPSAG